ncbi:MAG: hypothetical protein ACR2FY_14905 [Pirellulaceae bacterium]
MVSADQLRDLDSSGGSPLTATQKKTLEAYLLYRVRPPTLSSLIVRYVPYWALAIIVLSVLLAILASLDPYVALLLGTGAIGYMIALIGRDIRYTWQIACNLPLILRVLDWKEIERLCSKS